MLNNVNIKVFPFQGGNRSAAPAALKGENQFGNIKKIYVLFFPNAPKRINFPPHHMADISQPPSPPVILSVAEGSPPPLRP